MNEIMVVRTVLPFWYTHIKEVPTAMAVSFMTLWSLWAFLLLVLFLKSAFAHYEGNGADNVKYNHKLLNHLT